MTKMVEHIAERDVEFLVTGTLGNTYSSPGRRLSHSMQETRDYFTLMQQRSASIVPGTHDPEAITRRLVREDRFQSIAGDIVEQHDVSYDPISITPSHRVFMTDMVVLFGLLSSGRLDKLYERKQHRLRALGYSVDTSEASILAQKTNIAIDYLRMVRNHLREADYAEQDSPIVIGYEIEYRPFLQRIIEQRDRYPQEFLKITADMPEDLIEVATKNNAVATSVLERLGLIMEEDEGRGKRETKTYPSASIGTQQAEFTALLLSGGLSKQKIVVHETISGLTLSPEHTEIMDWLAIEIASGLLPFQMAEERIRRLKAGNGLKERFSKISYLPDGTPLYIPYHTVGKERTGGVITYPKGAPDRLLVERRSAIRFAGAKTAQQFNRQARASFLAAWGIRAVQMMPDQALSQRDKALSAAWIKLQSEWKNLLEEYGLQSPPEDPHGEGIRFWMLTDPDDPKMKRKTTYEYFIDKIVLLTKENTVFRRKSMRLVREYQQVASKLI